MKKENIKIIGTNDFMGTYVLNKVKDPRGTLVDGMEKFELIKGEESAMRFSLISKQLKHLMGEVLTTLEASISNEKQLQASKSIVKNYFGRKIDWIYELCGCPEEEQEGLMNPTEVE